MDGHSFKSNLNVGHFLILYSQILEPWSLNPEPRIKQQNLTTLMQHSFSHFRQLPSSWQILSGLHDDGAGRSGGW